jgi:hypothetical protein
MAQPSNKSTVSRTLSGTQLKEMRVYQDEKGRKSNLRHMRDSDDDHPQVELHHRGEFPTFSGRVVWFGVAQTD